MPTIIDVARAAGVSTATVSRTLSHTGVVTEDTRIRVMEAVERLAYAPNVAARTLRTARARKLLVTVPDISNPFFSNVIRGAEEAARDAGYAVVLGDTRHDAVLENQYAEMLARREVDGLIFLGHRLPDSLATLVRARAGGAPVVNGCEFSPGMDVPSVHIDNFAASRDVMEHLIALGHRNIGIITGPLTSPLGRDRLAGAQKAVAEHTPPLSLTIDHGDYSVDSGALAAHRLIERGVTAIFCCSDEMAMGALSAIRAVGLSCPDDISLVGFDDIRFARFMDPPLTTVSQPQPEIGRETVRLLIKLIEKDPDGAKSLTLPYKLVVRASTGVVRPRT